jgi:hypothetical protein
MSVEARSDVEKFGGITDKLALLRLRAFDKAVFHRTRPRRFSDGLFNFGAAQLSDLGGRAKLTRRLFDFGFIAKLVVENSAHEKGSCE